MFSSPAFLIDLHGAVYIILSQFIAPFQGTWSKAHYLPVVEFPVFSKEFQHHESVRNHCWKLNNENINLVLIEDRKFW